MEVIDEIKIINGSSRISITIDNMGKAILKHSKDVNKRAVQKFIDSKKEWILKKKEEKLNAITKNQDIISYKKIVILGKVYNLKNTKRKNKLDGDTIYYSSIKNLLNIISKISNDTLKEKFNYYLKLIKVNANSFVLDDSKTRWGVCTAKRIIKINFRALMLPEYLLNYIIIHELCHIIQFNHSKLFWKEVKKYCPDYKQYKIDIKEYSFLLDLYR